MRWLKKLTGQLKTQYVKSGMRRLSKVEIQNTHYDILLRFNNVINQENSKDKDMLCPVNLLYTFAYLTTRFKISQFKLLN